MKAALVDWCPPKSTAVKTSGNPGMTAAKKGSTTDKDRLYSNNSNQNSGDSGAVAQDKEDISDNRCLQSQQKSQTTLRMLNENAGSLQGRLGVYTQYLCIIVM